MKLIYVIKDSWGAHLGAQRDTRAYIRQVLKQLAEQKRQHPSELVQSTLTITVKAEQP